MEAYIIDTTLRDGEQAPGVVFSIQEKLEIAHALDAAGIDELEVGVAAMGSDEAAEITEIAKAGLNCKISTWARATENDIMASAATGCKAVNISFPVSDVQLAAIGKNRDWVRHELPEMVKLARKKFRIVNMGAQDASRADEIFLAEFAKECCKLGISRLRIADTVGKMNPVSAARLVNICKNSAPKMALEFHGHNDLGMATANALSALWAGADAISSTVNGLGERAGNAATEEVIVALSKSYGIKTKYSTTGMVSLSKLVALASGRALHVSKPISGSMALCHESGIHTRSLLRDRASYELIAPEEIGACSSFVYGKFSGTAAVKNLLESKGMVLCSDALKSVVRKIKNMSAASKRSFSETEVLEIASASMV
jgi:homocitrate synthase NifV